MSELPTFSVSEFVSLVNQTLDFAYPTVIVEGEVSAFRVAKNKYVYFDLKDEESTVNCFMTVYQLTTPIEEGMRLRVQASPRLTQWGRFSLTVRGFEIAGEGDIKKSIDLLRMKLEKEGLFDPERKRALPLLPARIGLITAADSAAYADFNKILNVRWGGLDIQIIDTFVQGMEAPHQIIKALEHFNQMSDPPDVIVLIRGGGSPDDLAAFSTEPVVRALASSRIPTMVGVGHESNISLADLVADQRASTPSNAAELLVPDKKSVSREMDEISARLGKYLESFVLRISDHISHHQQAMQSSLIQIISHIESEIASLSKILNSYSPKSVLRRGYALIKTENKVIRDALHLKIGEIIMIELTHGNAKAQIREINTVQTD